MTARARRGAGVIVLTLLLLVPTGRVAWAHTALAASSPAAGERVAYPPEEIVLSFAAPVRTATTTVRLRAADGSQIPLTTLTPDGTVDTLVLGVPVLDTDVYALGWESVGDDGHRATGEVVFGVGASPGDVAVAAAGGDAAALLLDGLGLALRLLWYLGLAAAAAAVVLGRGGTTLAAGVLADRGPRLWRLLAGMAVLRAVIGALTLLDAGADVTTVLTSRGTLVWAGLAGLLAVVGSRRPTGPALAVLAVVGGTLAGHAPDRPDAVQAVTFGAVHLGAAALWVGPVLGLVLLARTVGWRSLDPDERGAQMRAHVAEIATVAGWALAAVVTSGGVLALRAWDGQSVTTWMGEASTAVLLAKTVVVVAIAVPLGLHHHRRRERMVDVGGGLRTEAGALVLALALGAVLVVLDPGWGRATGDTDTTLAALLDGSAGPPERCADVDVGQATCYRTALEALLVAEGPQAAIDEVLRLSETDAFVAAGCHQVAHDLGNDAAERIADMGVALAVDGSACWSGYTHGFVEARLSDITDRELSAALPTFCDGAADPPYSFSHYNCLHGLGHGLMLRADADLFAALPLCEDTGELWAVHSCASGVFMENVMAAQQGQPAEFDDEDLLYPCTVMTDPVAEDCYLMQTSHVLWRLDGDVAGGFAWCDSAPQAHRATCYRSMGRDVSSRARLDPAGVVSQCDLGQPALVRWCLDGAASNAVYETADTTLADALCALVQGDRRDACTAARDQAARTVAAG